ncbi:hypothetical protein PAZ_c03170 [Cutibacterium acnes 266]|jgi:hypothetical protein|nr:hypothetical protein PAZ_c03170 [Cutibacterium acnes 266]MCW5106245.1 hypothetical protein [Cutibacterium acnes P07A]
MRTSGNVGYTGLNTLVPAGGSGIAESYKPEIHELLLRR